MDKITQLKQILDEIEIATMMEVVDCMWCRDDKDFKWNTDNSIEDLHNEDGNTYGGYQTEDKTEWGGYLVVNLDTQQGYWTTFLFPLDKEVTVDDDY